MTPEAAMQISRRNCIGEHEENIFISFTNSASNYQYYLNTRVVIMIAYLHTNSDTGQIAEQIEKVNQKHGELLLSDYLDPKYTSK